jgi:hypothetical protein
MLHNSASGFEKLDTAQEMLHRESSKPSCALIGFIIDFLGLAC